MTVAPRPAPGLDLDPELVELVGRTAGLQPWRRIFHAASGIVVALVPPVLGLGRGTVIWILAPLLALAVAADAVRLRRPRINALFFTLFPSLASPREATRISSSTWYLAGVLLAYALFPGRLVMPAILVLALADPLAGSIGRVWGRRRLGKGTILGSAVFLAVSAAVLSGFVEPAAALVAALMVTVIEVVPWELDDNLTVPLVAAGALWLIGG